MWIARASEGITKINATTLVGMKQEVTAKKIVFYLTLVCVSMLLFVVAIAADVAAIWYVLLCWSCVYVMYVI